MPWPCNSRHTHQCTWEACLAATPPLHSTATTHILLTPRAHGTALSSHEHYPGAPIVAIDTRRGAHMQRPAPPTLPRAARPSSARARHTRQTHTRLPVSHFPSRLRMTHANAAPYLESSHNTAAGQRAGAHHLLSVPTIPPDSCQPHSRAAAVPATNASAPFPPPRHSSPFPPFRRDSAAAAVTMPPATPADTALPQQ